jgi:hypothetical protein
MKTETIIIGIKPAKDWAKIIAHASVEDAEIIVQQIQDEARRKALWINMDMQKANNILRAAMYDIVDYDTDGDEIARCGQMAEAALTKSALDEDGCLAATPNDKIQP